MNKVEMMNPLDPLSMNSDELIDMLRDWKSAERNDVIGRSAESLLQAPLQESDNTINIDQLEEAVDGEIEGYNSESPSDDGSDDEEAAHNPADFEPRPLPSATKFKRDWGSMPLKTTLNYDSTTALNCDDVTDFNYQSQNDRGSIPSAMRRAKGDGSISNDNYSGDNNAFGEQCHSIQGQLHEDTMPRKMKRRSSMPSLLIHSQNFNQDASTNISENIFTSDDIDINPAAEFENNCYEERLSLQQAEHDLEDTFEMEEPSTHRRHRQKRRCSMPMSYTYQTEIPSENVSAISSTCTSTEQQEIERNNGYGRNVSFAPGGGIPTTSSDNIPDQIGSMQSYDTCFSQQQQPQQPQAFSSDMSVNMMSQDDMMMKLHQLMMKSEMTQKALQNWDKKQGLPKNHSSTMVSTSRSRTQLQEGVILTTWNGTPLTEAAQNKQTKKAHKMGRRGSCPY